MALAAANWHEAKKTRHQAIGNQQEENQAKKPSAKMAPGAVAKIMASGGGKSSKAKTQRAINEEEKAINANEIKQLAAQRHQKYQ
jgi:hypothetical protein